MAYGIGYFLGEEVRSNLKADGVEADPDLLLAGFSAGINGREPTMPRAELDALLRAVDREMKSRMARRLMAEDAEFRQLALDNDKASAAFLAEYAAQPGVVTLDSGLMYRVVTAGSNQMPKPTLDDTVIVDYTAKLTDGFAFKTENDAEVPIRSLLAAGREILPMMPTGSTWEVAVPATLAWGDAGDPPFVGPREAVVFTITLKGIK